MEIKIPRELSDAIWFTVAHTGNLTGYEHIFTEREGFGSGLPPSYLNPVSALALFVDGEAVSVDIHVTTSCEQTSFIVPVKADYRQIAVASVEVLAFEPHYPLDIEQMKTFNEEGQNFTIGMITDAKKCDAIFSKEEKRIHIDIKGRDEANNTGHGDFYLSVPHELLDGNYSVYVDGKPVAFKESVFSLPGNAGTFRSGILFNYTKDATQIGVIGTTAIPEFSSFALIVMAASVAAVVLLKSRFGYLAVFSRRSS